MTVISYKTSVPGRLAAELAAGFERLSIKKAAHGRPYAIVLWHSGGRGLKIVSAMHDIAERLEVGVLEFSRVAAPLDGASDFDLPDEFHSGLKASKLVLSLNGLTVESGIVLEGRCGDEIVLVAGAQPYTIAGKASFIADTFEPEYPLSKYARELIS